MRTPNEEGLNAYRLKRRAELERSATKAIEHLFELNEEVNFHSVSKKGNVSRNFLYTNKVISKKILKLREPSKIRHQKKIGNFSKAANNTAVKLKHVSERYKKLLAENKALKKEIDTLRAYIEAISNPK